MFPCNHLKYTNPRHLVLLQQHLVGPAIVLLILAEEE